VKRLSVFTTNFVNKNNFNWNRSKIQPFDLNKPRQSI
jgi:hypothetical protein